MEKKKINGFQLVLLLVVLVVGGALLALGLIKRSEYTKNVDQFKTQATRLAKMESMEGYPSDESVAQLKEGLVSYRGKIEGVRESLKSSVVTSFINVNSGDFASKLNKSHEEVKRVYTDKRVSFPENWYLGFEKYTAVPALKEATGILSYQLDALKWIHLKLGEHSPVALNNVHRSALSQESSEQKKAKKTPKGKMAQPVYHRMPLELTFTSTEANARAFLNDLAKSQEYYYVINTIKIQSIEAPEGAEILVEDNEAAEPSQDGASEENLLESVFDNTETEEDEEAISEDNGNKLFEQVLGNENVVVFLDLDLIYLPAKLELPEIR